MYDFHTLPQQRPNPYEYTLTPVYRDDLWSYGGPPLDSSTTTTTTPPQRRTTTRDRPPEAIRTQETITERLLREALELTELKRAQPQKSVDDTPHTVVQSSQTYAPSPIVSLLLFALLARCVWWRERRKRRKRQ